MRDFYGEIVAALRVVRPTIGTNIASATPSTTTSADLISAVTNATGVIITSFSIWLNEQTNSVTSTLDLVVNGSSIMQCGCTARADGPGNAAMGGFCNIEIPAGQAVGYAAVEGGTMTSKIMITYKAK